MTYRFPNPYPCPEYCYVCKGKNLNFGPVEMPMTVAGETVIHEINEWGCDTCDGFTNNMRDLEVVELKTALRAVLRNPDNPEVMTFAHKALGMKKEEFEEMLEFQITIDSEELVAALDSMSSAIDRGAEPSPEQLKELNALSERQEKYFRWLQNGNTVLVEPTERLKALAAEIVSLVPAPPSEPGLPCRT